MKTIIEMQNEKEQIRVDENGFYLEKISDEEFEIFNQTFYLAKYIETANCSKDLPDAFRLALEIKKILSLSEINESIRDSFMPLSTKEKPYLKSILDKL